MASKGDIEKPIHLVRPVNAKAVQAVLDRAHRQEKSADREAARGIGRGMRGKGPGLLSKTLGLAMSHHGRSKKGAQSLRPTAPDTGGRAFHFSHTTVGKAARGAQGGAGGKGADGGGGSGGAGAGPATAGGTASGGGDAGTREAGHQSYVERKSALARDQAEQYGFEVGPQREPAAGRTRQGPARTEGIEIARPVALDMDAVKAQVERAGRGEEMRSAAAGQAYIEDASKVVAQTRHGHSNSFGTIGQTYAERLRFWDLVHEHEREKDARTQIRLVLELPHEASAEARQEIVRRFCERYEELGVPYWCSIHAPTAKNDSRNHHAHVVHGIRPARQMTDPATGEVAWDFTITETYRKKNRVKKTRHPFRQNAVKAFRDRDYPRQTRLRFAEATNSVMKRHHCPIRYDARSYRDMGLDIEPMKHVARILADKGRSHDFTVLDPVWTRTLIEREMQAAAMDRDRTYRRLRKVERDLAAVSKDVRHVNKANLKLPHALRLPPASRLTAAAAKAITKRMLAVERERLAQRFADESTARTIQHVIDATAPTSAHRGGKARRAHAAQDPAAVPDADAMSTLHAAALEEMRLHRLRSANGARRLALKASAALRAWQEAGQAELPKPPPVPEPPAPPRGPGRMDPRRPNPPVPPVPEPSRQRSPPAPTQQAPAPAVGRPVMPCPVAAPSPQPRTPHPVLAATAARMKATLQNVVAMTDGPQAFADAMRSMMAAAKEARRPPMSQETQQGAALAPTATAPTQAAPPQPTLIQPTPVRPATTQATPPTPGVRSPAPVRPPVEVARDRPATPRPPLTPMTPMTGTAPTVPAPCGAEPLPPSRPEAVTPSPGLPPRVTSPVAPNTILRPAADEEQPVASATTRPLSPLEKIADLLGARLVKRKAQSNLALPSTDDPKILRPPPTAMRDRPKLDRSGPRPLLTLNLPPVAPGNTLQHDSGARTRDDDSRPLQSDDAAPPGPDERTTLSEDHERARKRKARRRTIIVHDRSRER